MSEGAGRELRDALVVCLDERAPYKLIIVIICVECGAEECGANFHAVHCAKYSRWFCCEQRSTWSSETASGQCSSSMA